MSTPTGRLAGQVAIVTGAAQGQGEAEVTRFVLEGAKVVIADVNDEAGAALAEELGPDALFCHLDVTDEAGRADVAPSPSASSGPSTSW